MSAAAIGKGKGLMISKRTAFTTSHRHYSHMIGCWNTGVFSWDDPQQRQLCLDSLDNWHSGQNEPWTVESIKCPPPSDCAQNSKIYTVIAVIEHVPMEVGA